MTPATELLGADFQSIKSEFMETSRLLYLTKVFSSSSSWTSRAGFRSIEIALQIEKRKTYASLRIIASCFDKWPLEFSFIGAGPSSLTPFMCKDLIDLLNIKELRRSDKNSYERGFEFMENE